MQPELWGKHLWTSVHFIALGYPKNPTPEEVQYYYDFFTNLWKVIPCYKCSVNYKRHLQELPIEPYLKTKMSLFEWTVKVHNIVNKELGKQEMSLADALKLYTSESTNVESQGSILSPQKPFTACLIMIVIVCVLLFFVMRSKRLKL